MRRLVNRYPGKGSMLVLGMLPFLLMLLIYMAASSYRLSENPNDKLLPSLSTIQDSVQQYAVNEDRRSGQRLLWTDTFHSLKRLLLGLLCAALLGLLFGVSVGVIPYVRATLAPLIAALSMIPPLAILPVLFIVFGLGELSKVILIVIGIAPFIMRDLALKIGDIPSEQLIKAQTLGANTWQIIVRVVLPQIMPRLLDALRLSLGPAWLFLIAAEAIAATDGLGYRIFLVRRYMAMDVILPYVVWITLLAFIMDFSIKLFSNWRYRWYQPVTNR